LLYQLRSLEMFARESARMVRRPRLPRAIENEEKVCVPRKYGYIVIDRAISEVKNGLAGQVLVLDGKLAESDRQTRAIAAKNTVLNSRRVMVPKPKCIFRDA
jgi:hypothetical protein